MGVDTRARELAMALQPSSTIGDRPLSSRQLIDTFAPELSESGNPVVCHPVASYPLGIMAHWAPQQSGTGDPSPENIRPFIRRESVAVTRCGANLLNPDLIAHNVYLPYGCTITYLGDNKIHISGTYASEGGSFVIMDTQQPLLAGKKLTITGFVTDGTAKNFTLYGLRTADETAIAMQGIDWHNGDTIDMTVAIVVSAEQPSEYQPYTGQSIILPVPDGVIGGRVDVDTGAGLNEWKLLEFDGTENWYVNENRFFLATNKLFPGMRDGFPDDAKSNYATFVRDIHFSGNAEFSVREFATGNSWVGFSFPGIATLDDFKTFLSTQHAAGKPVQVAIKLTQSVPFATTGAQTIRALSGTNTILTDADSIDVSGRTDPVHALIELQDAIASIAGGA